MLRCCIVIPFVHKSGLPFIRNFVSAVVDRLKGHSSIHAFPPFKARLSHFVKGRLLMNAKSWPIYVLPITIACLPKLPTICPAMLLGTIIEDVTHDNR